MSPEPSRVVITPSSRSHSQELPSFDITQLSRSSPLKRMIASEGGVPALLPGVTISGLGSHISEASDVEKSFIGLSCAVANIQQPMNAYERKIYFMNPEFRRFLTSAGQ